MKQKISDVYELEVYRSSSSSISICSVRTFSSADLGRGLASIIQLVREASRHVQVCFDVSVSIISCSPNLIYLPLSLHFRKGTTRLIYRDSLSLDGTWKFQSQTPISISHQSLFAM